jgi:hypothetical protein
VTTYIEPDTQSTQITATSHYVRFCSDRDMEPWPVTRWSFALWVWQEAAYVSLPTLFKCYMGHIKRSQISRQEPWTLDKDPIVRRVLIALKKRYGMSSKSTTAALTLEDIWLLARNLRGFTCGMSHDDRLWLFASVMGCLGLLRGGEFLVSSKQSRPILRLQELSSVEVLAGVFALVVQVPKPKARWWEAHVPVTIFALPGTPLCVQARHWSRKTGRRYPSSGFSRPRSTR